MSHNGELAKMWGSMHCNAIYLYEGYFLPDQYYTSFNLHSKRIFEFVKFILCCS